MCFMMPIALLWITKSSAQEICYWEQIFIIKTSTNFKVLNLLLKMMKVLILQFMFQKTLVFLSLPLCAGSLNNKKQSRRGRRGRRLSLVEEDAMAGIALHLRRQMCRGLLPNHGKPGQLAFFSSTTPVSDQLRKNEAGKVTFLSRLGLSREKINELLCKNPKISAYTPVEFETRWKLFKRAGINGQNFCRVIATNPKVMSVSIEQELKPTVSSLKSALKENYAQSITMWPALLTPQQDLRGKINFLVKAGFEKGSVELAKALTCVLHKSLQEIEVTIAVLTDLGLSRDQTYRLLRQQPSVLQQSPAELSSKVDYILKRADFSVEDLLKHAAITVYNLELRIKPRHMMHNWLKSQGLLKKKFQLNYFVNLPEDEFVHKFVDCHAGGKEVYHEFKGDTS